MSKHEAAPRGWLGRARALVARVVERGLHLPDAAKLLRGDPGRPPDPPPPLATVTLAEIYAAQGYTKKARAVVAEILERQPEHREAAAMLARLGGASTPVEPAAEASTAVEPEAEASTPVEPAAEASTAVEPEAEASTPVEPEAEASTAVEPAATDVPTDPSRSERDRLDDLVALATDPGTVYVYWEIRPLTFARARWRDAQGRLVMRVLSAADQCVTRDVAVDEIVGDTFIRGLAAGAEVRLCMGWDGPRGFRPLAIAPALRMPRDYQSHVETTHRVDLAVATQMQEALRAATASPLAAVASDRLRGYVARLATQRRSPSEVDLQSIGGVGGHGFGGASDLYGGASELAGGGTRGTTEPVAGSISAMGRQKDLRR